MIVINLNLFFDHGEEWLSKTIKNIKQDVYPDNWQIILEYDKDIFKSDEGPGILLSYTIEELVKTDIPFYFVRIKTAYKNITNDINVLKNIHADYESCIKILVSTNEFIKLIDRKDSICIYPWIHFYINQQGNIGACCEGNDHYPLGNIKNISLSEVHNLPKFKQLRLQMLSQQQPKHCEACWTKEDQGIKSSRQSANEKYKNYKYLIANTNKDGSVSNFKLKYADLRDNNLCNLKCRMCSGKFSSSIAQEEYKIWNNSKHINLSNDRNTTDKIIEYLKNNIQSLDCLYFAGGEPLLLDSHYKILELLINKNRECNVIYNTNLTNLNFKDKHVLNYWKILPNVTVGASIDLTGNRASYVRHGSDYDIIKENYKSIKDFVKFKITSTLSIYNIFDLQLLQKEWIELGVMPQDISFNLLINPDYMSIQVLPEDFKNLAKDSINKHIEFLQQKDNTNNIVNQWLNAVKYMTLANKSFLLGEFFKDSDIKDKFRNESFEESFPEFKNLRKYISV